MVEELKKLRSLKKTADYNDLIEHQKKYSQIRNEKMEAKFKKRVDENDEIKKKNNQLKEEIHKKFPKQMTPGGQESDHNDELKKKEETHQQVLKK